jgi:hypothetical protein
MSRFPDNVDVVYAKAPQASVNSGATDSGTEVNGDQVDLQAAAVLNTNGTSATIRYRRVRVAFPYSVSVGTTGTTVSFASNLQHRIATSGTGSTWADFGTAPAAHVSADSGTSTGSVFGAFEYEQDLTLVNRYLRVQVTPTFSATTTGDALLSYSGSFVFMDANRNPADGA